MWKQKLAIYDKIIATNSKFERKGKTVPYTSANGYMFTLLNKEAEIGFRLPKPVAREFIEKYNSGPFKSYGAVMRDYVLIPEDLLQNLELLADYLDQSYEFVMSLPPK